MRKLSNEAIEELFNLDTDGYLPIVGPTKGILYEELASHGLVQLIRAEEGDLMAVRVSPMGLRYRMNNRRR